MHDRTGQMESASSNTSGPYALHSHSGTVLRSPSRIGIELGQKGLHPLHRITSQKVVAARLRMQVHRSVLKYHIKP